MTRVINWFRIVQLTFRNVQNVYKPLGMLFYQIIFAWNNTSP